jgi:hypothetical protein
MLMSLATYEAALYWKLYSTRGDTINREIHNKPSVIPELISLLPRLSGFPPRIYQNGGAVLDLVTRVRGLGLYGMQLPVCTALLHFLYPDVIPIFDKMVLMAVGYTGEQIKKRTLNQNEYLYGQYMEHVWSLTKTYANHINAQKYRESSVRVIDMALWVTR